jgi:hypothetical protein
MASDEVGQLSALTGARQTMMSWALVVESWDDVPQLFREPYRALVIDAPRLPYTVFAPPMEGPSLKIIGYQPPPKLLCELDDTIYMWELAAERVTLTAFRFQDISDLEVGEIHLYSWIKISGVTQDGFARPAIVEFNRATARHFTPFIDKIRPAPRPMDERREREERHKLDAIGLWSFKFRNYALDSLVGGDAIVGTVGQPETFKPLVQIGGRVLYQTTLSLARVVILTDRELIVIQDDERSRKTRGVRYGGRWQYIALSHVGKVSLRDDGDGLVRLCLTLSPGDREMEIGFSASRKEQVAQLVDSLEKLIG